MSIRNSHFFAFFCPCFIGGFVKKSHAMKHLKLLVPRPTAYPLRLASAFVNGVILPGAVADAGIATKGRRC